MANPRKLIGGLVTVFTSAEPPLRTSFSLLAEWQPTFPPTRPEIRVLLQLTEERISSQTRSSLDIVDGEDGPKVVVALLRGVRAYFELQDVLHRASASYEGKPRFETDHCYYESVVYLRESLMAWIQGNELAAMALLRPFLELSLLHLYWSAFESFEPLFRWIDGKSGKPTFRQIRETVVTNLATSELIDSIDAKRVSDFFADAFGVISSYNHTPRPEESTFTREDFLGSSPSASGAYYATIVEALLRHLVLLYILVYPGSLFPVDRRRKWGYNYGPVGLLADQSTTNIIHDFLGHTFDMLRNRFDNHQQVKDLLSFYENQPDLSPSDIESSWHSNLSFDMKTKATQDSDTRQALVKAHVRSMGWMMNYSGVNTRPDLFLDGFVSRARSAFAELTFLS